MCTGLSCDFVMFLWAFTGVCMKGQLPNPVQEVYSSDGWTQWNPLLSAENRPAHISSAVHFWQSR